MHQSDYSDTTRRELIWENLTKKILDNKSIRYIIGGDMNVAPTGDRDGYSQNPATVHLRNTADEALVNFQDTAISVTAEALGDIQHDHLSKAGSQLDDFWEMGHDKPSQHVNGTDIGNHLVQSQKEGGRLDRSLQSGRGHETT